MEKGKETEFCPVIVNESLKILLLQEIERLSSDTVALLDVELPR